MNGKFLMHHFTFKQRLASGEICVVSSFELNLLIARCENEALNLSLYDCRGAIKMV